MTSLATAFVDIKPDLRGFGTSLSRGVRTDAAKAGTEAGRSLSGKFAGALKIGGALAAAFAVTKGISFFKDSIKGASDLSETMNKSRVIFRNHAGEMARWSKGSASNLGLSQQAALEAAASFGDMFSQIGFSGDASAKMSRNVVKLSADLGSFNNLPTAEVNDMIAASFRGEYDSLQRVIPNINAARVQQVAMNETGKTSAKTLTAQEKAHATLSIIQKDGARAQGDFARTSGGLANTQKILSARTDNLKAALGRGLLPIVTAVAKFVSNQVVPAMTSFVKGVQSGTGAGGRLAAVFSGIAGVIGRVIATFRSGSSGVSAFGGQLAKTASAVGTFGRALLPTLLSIGRQLKAVVGPAIRDIGNLVTTQFLPSFRKMLPIILPVAKFLLQMFGSALVGAVKGAVQVIKGFINVISGVFKLVSAVIHGEWGKAWAAVKQIVKGALNVVIGAIRVWFNVGILSVFKGGVLRILGAWRGLGTGLKTVATGGLRLTVGAIKAGLALIGRAFAAALRVLTAPWRLLFVNLRVTAAAGWQLIRRPFTAAMSALGGVLRTAGRILLAPWRVLFTGLKAAATVGWRLVKGAFTAAFTFLAGAIRGAVRVIAAPFRTLFTGLRTVAVTGWRLVKGAFTAAFSVLAGAIRAAVTRLVTPFRALFTAYKTAATTGWRIIKSAFTTALNAVRAVVSAVVSRVVAAWRTFFGALRSVAAAGWRIIKGAFTTAANAVRTVVSAVVNRLTGMWRTFFGALRSVAAAGWRIIKGAFTTAANAIRSVVSTVVNRITGAWRTFFGTLRTVATNAWRIIRGTFSTVLNTIRTVVGNIVSRIATAWRTFFGTVRTITANAWRIIKGAFSTALNTIRTVVGNIVGRIATAWRTFFGTIRTITGNALRIIKGAFTTGFNAIRDIVAGRMKAVARTWSTVWAGIRTIGGKLASLVKTTIPGAFRTGAGAIATAWAKVASAAKKPVRYVVNTVWNNGLRKVIGAIPGVGTPRYIGGFARGGVMPGYTPGRDVHRFVSPTGGTLDLSGGEAVMRPEWTRTVGKDLVDKWNGIARRGGTKALQRAMELGGDSRKRSRVGPHQRLAAGGLNVAGAVTFAKSQVGKPYIWGGVGPGGYDCSGFMSAITNVLRRRSPYSRVGATASFPWSGFVPGPGQFTIGSSPNYQGQGVGHMAGTLNGMNVESSGGRGVHIGGGARGWNSAGFTRHAHLGPGGNFGGGGGAPARVKWSMPNPLRFMHLASWMKSLSSMGPWGGMVKKGIPGMAGKVVSYVKTKVVAFLKGAISGLTGWLTGTLTGSKLASRKVGIGSAGQVIGKKDGGILAFDRGGVATGFGVLLKRTIQPERMLDPRTTRNFERLTIALDRMDTDRSRGGGTGVQRFVLDIGGGRVLTGYIDDRIDTRKAAIDQRAAVRRKVVT